VNGEYFAVVVYGANIPKGPQNYALVVNGLIQKVTDNTFCGNTAAFCPGNCGANRKVKWGTCNTQTGLCTCRATRTGPGCNVPIHVLQPISNSPKTYSYSGSVDLRQTLYLSFVLTAADIAALKTGLTFTLTSPTPFSTNSTEGMGVFFSFVDVPNAAKYQRAPILMPLPVRLHGVNLYCIGTSLQLGDGLILLFILFVVLRSLLL